MAGVATVLHDLLSMPLYHHYLVAMDYLDTLESPVAEAEGVPGEHLEASSLLTSQSLKVKSKNGFAGSPRPGGLVRGPVYTKSTGTCPPSAARGLPAFTIPLRHAPVPKDHGPNAQSEHAVACGERSTSSASA